MRREQSNRVTWYQLSLIALLLLACVVLLAGTALARYRTDEVSYLNYTAKTPDSVFLWSGYNEQTRTLSAGQSSWTSSGTLDFYISNGTVDAPAEETQRVSVRLLASLAALENADAMEVHLYVTQGETVTEYVAEAVPIAEGTALYRSFGAGQTYIFRDESGAEASWTLEGGVLSVLSAQIIINGLEQPDDAALLQLQVTGDISTR